MAEVKIEGLTEIRRNLAALAAILGDKKAQSPVRSALRVAAKRVRDDAMRRVPVDSGALRKNITIKSAPKRYLPPGQVAVNVGVNSRTAEYRNNAKNRRAGRVGKEYRDLGQLYYAMFVEFGTPEGTNRKGNFRGKGLRSRPFLRPAFDQNAARLPQDFRDALAPAIDKWAKRQLKK